MRHSRLMSLSLATLVLLALVPALVLAHGPVPPPPNVAQGGAASSSTSVTTTFAPSLAKRRASASPCPRAPPVMSTTLSSSLFTTASPLWLGSHSTGMGQGGVSTRIPAASRAARALPP